MNGRCRRATSITLSHIDCLRRWTAVIQNASHWRSRCSGTPVTGKGSANGATPRKRRVRMVALATRPYGARRTCDGQDNDGSVAVALVVALVFVRHCDHACRDRSSAQYGSRYEVD
ncbi:hypothetical protein G6F40_016023 [Rhizopus arrhizus]|nr:hypothetical protein G6F40_016023 [Rhizopus arrhizus]